MPSYIDLYCEFTKTSVDLIPLKVEMSSLLRSVLAESLKVCISCNAAILYRMLISLGWDDAILGADGNEGMSLGEKATLTITR
jgi:hypothetical protein